MKYPKLIEGLLFLDKSEWLSLRKYALMYCTETSDNFRLLDQFFRVRGRLADREELSRIKDSQFRGMSTKNFSNLMSRVNQWFEEWLVWHEGKKDDDLRDVELVRILNRRGAYGLADKVYHRVEKRLLGRKTYDKGRNKYLYLLHHYHYFSDNPVKYRRKAEILESLISYYSLQATEQAMMYEIELFNWGGIQQHDYRHEMKLLAGLITIQSDTRMVQIIGMIRRLVFDLDAGALVELKEVLEAGEITPDSEMYILASLYLVTFSLRLWNSHKTSDAQLIFDIYHYGLHSGVLLKTGKMPFVRFINLITTLGHIQTADQAYDFVDKWKHLVAGEDAVAIQSVAYAQLKFVEEKYHEINPLLLGVKCESEAGKLRHSVLEIIGLYTDEHRNYSLLHNRIQNYKRVLRTYGNKRSNLTHQSLLNFAKVLELLVKREFARIRIQLEDYNPVVYKNWLEKEIKAGL